MYVGTTEAARQIGVSPSTLRWWLRTGLIREPRISVIHTLGGKLGTVRIRQFDMAEVEWLRQFAVRRRTQQRERRRNYRLHPKMKAARAAMRKAIGETEKLFHVAEWFQSHPLTSNPKMYRSWENARKTLAASGLLTSDDKLTPDTSEGLRAKLATLKAEYAAAVAKPPTVRLDPSREEVMLNLRMGTNRSSVVRGGTR